MARPYNITINNGSGSANVLNGSYTVTSNTKGYNDTSIDPSSITVDAATNSYNLKISATGALTLHVSEDGTSSGTAVVGAKFIRCDQEGNTYGSEITSDGSGNAVFNNVPYSSDSSILIYYKQTASDGEHDFDNTLKNISLSTETLTNEVTNALPLPKTFNLTDSNYDGLKIDSGQLTLS